MVVQEFDLQDRLIQGLHYHQSADLGNAQVIYRSMLVADPVHHDALHLQGVARHQAGTSAQAVPLIRWAIRVNPLQAGFHINLGSALKAVGHIADAIACYHAALSLSPDSGDAFNNLGNALREHGALAESIIACQWALRCRPKLSQAHFNLALALHEQGQKLAALEHYDAVLKDSPMHAEAYNNVAALKLELGEIPHSMANCRRAICIRPSYASGFNNLGNAFRKLGRYDDAGKFYLRALTVQPNNFETHNNIGLSRQDGGLLGEAARHYQMALLLRPQFTEAYNNLGLTLQEQGRLREATDAFRRALHLRPDFDYVEMSLAFCQLYRPGINLPEIWRQACRWGDRQPPAQPQNFRFPLATQRPQIGFVSADLRAHAVAYLVLPALEELHRIGWQITFYSNSDRVDDVTARFRAIAARWRIVGSLTDDALAAQIRADQIGILFDLAGFSGDNRLTCLVRKPAPIQIGWVGYPATTGLEAMDYLIADPVQIPQGADRWYREKIIRLPVCYVAYQPFNEVSPPDRLPALSGDGITFGSFNVLKKITPKVARAWSQILQFLPDSKLLLKTPALNCPATRQIYSDLFNSLGIVEKRLIFIGATPPAQHLAWMARADIALDAFPYSGGQTTLDALWMGLPVVTLPSDTMSSRHSLGYLSAIGLSELVATDEDHYIELVVNLAQDVQRLSALRAGMRQVLLASPLCDVEAFSRHLATAMETVWQRWRDGGAPQAVAINA